MLFFAIAAAAAAVPESRVALDEVSLLQLRRKGAAGAADEKQPADEMLQEYYEVEPWPQFGPNYRKCADATGHRIHERVSDCGSSMIDISIANKEVEGEYYQPKGRGSEYKGPGCTEEDGGTYDANLDMIVCKPYLSLRYK